MLAGLLSAILVGLAPAVPAAPDQAALRLERIATLDAPVHATAPRSEPGRLYVVEQAGRIRVLVNGRLRAAPFLDITGLVASGGERGLLSMAFHPAYARNRRFYVNYTDRNGHTRVVEYRSNGTRGLPGTARRLLLVRQPYSTTTAASWRSGRTGSCTWAWATAGPAETPRTAPRTSAIDSASC